MDDSQLLSTVSSIVAVAVSVLVPALQFLFTRSREERVLKRIKIYDSWVDKGSEQYLANLYALIDEDVGKIGSNKQSLVPYLLIVISILLEIVLAWHNFNIENYSTGAFAVMAVVALFMSLLLIRSFDKLLTVGSDSLRLEKWRDLRKKETKKRIDDWE